jgi:hypothetical protein
MNKQCDTPSTTMSSIINFPECLDISPSISPKEFENNIQMVGAIFGGAAQREAIEKYGIAGRVW